MTRTIGSCVGKEVCRFKINVMKRSILLLAVLAFSFMSYAQVDETECETFVIRCASGGGTILKTCGSVEQVVKDLEVVMEAVCNN